MTFTVNSSEWSTTGTSGQAGYGYTHERSASIITDAIYSNGAVQAYMKLGGDGVALPFTVPTSTWSTTFMFGYNPGTVKFEVYDSDFLTTQPSTAEYKVVAIASSGMPTAPLDLLDYEVVAEYYGL